MKDEPVSHDFIYVHADIPAGMTIREWRAQRAADRAAARRAGFPAAVLAWQAAHRCGPRLVARGTPGASCPRARGSRVTRRALTGAMLAVVASVAVTVIEGTPRHLPGVALGSPVLLHAERALALLAVTVAAFSILVQVARGRLPIELSTSGLRYEAEAADDAACLLYTSPSPRD